jgi:type I restriction enzyme, S subunit
MSLLEQHFDVAFAAPDGIKKLRELILTLAMQGKLVPQDLDDEPASQLLQEIEAEKKRLVKEKHIRATRLLPEIDLENVPYILPNGWKWVQLGNIAILENGDRSNKYPNETDHQISGVPFFGAKDIVNGILRFDNGLRFISEAKFLELSNGKLVDKDFVVLLRGTVGKMAIFRTNPEFSTGFINAQMLIVRMLNKELCDFFSWYIAILFEKLVLQYNIIK